MHNLEGPRRQIELPAGCRSRRTWTRCCHDQLEGQLDPRSDRESTASCRSRSSIDATKGREQPTTPTSCGATRQVIVPGRHERPAAPARMNTYPYILSPFLGGLGQPRTRSATTAASEHHLRPGCVVQRVNRHQPRRTGPARVRLTARPASARSPCRSSRTSGPTRTRPSKPSRGSVHRERHQRVADQPRRDLLADGPNFRAYSAGRGGEQCRSRSDPSQLRTGSRPKGGWDTPTGAMHRSPSATTAVYWVMADFLKRTAVVTSGFVEITNPAPHAGRTATRASVPTRRRRPCCPDFVYDFEPPLGQNELPPGTSIVTEFRGAEPCSTTTTRTWPRLAQMPVPCSPADPSRPNASNFSARSAREVGRCRDGSLRQLGRSAAAARRELALDLHVQPQRSRATRTDPKQLRGRPQWTNTFSGPSSSQFPAKDVKYFNWRFVLRNNVQASPPVSPKLDAFYVSYG